MGIVFIQYSFLMIMKIKFELITKLNIKIQYNKGL